MRERERERDRQRFDSKPMPDLNERGIKTKQQLITKSKNQGRNKTGSSEKKIEKSLVLTRDLVVDLLITNKATQIVFLSCILYQTLIARVVKVFTNQNQYEEEK